MIHWLRAPAKPEFKLPEWFKVGETIADRTPDGKFAFRKITAIDGVRGDCVHCSLDGDSRTINTYNFSTGAIAPAKLVPWTLEELTSHLQQDVINTKDTTIQPRISKIWKDCPDEDWNICLCFHRAGVTQHYCRSAEGLLRDHTLTKGSPCGTWTVA